MRCVSRAMINLEGKRNRMCTSLVRYTFSIAALCAVFVCYSPATISRGFVMVRGVNGGPMCELWTENSWKWVHRHNWHQLNVPWPHHQKWKTPNDRERERERRFSPSPIVINYNTLLSARHSYEFCSFNYFSISWRRHSFTCAIA